MIYSMNAVGKPAMASFRSSVLRRVAIVFAMSILYIMPLSARASNEEEKYPIDARLENYPQKVTLEESGTALSWVIFIVLTALCVGVMFKNANRSHLD